MHLREVVLSGFKSFADTTILKLDPGVTAIVGPNGCGKSNIADAIRWVLGEQSAKALRGGRMPDVIFAGTESRKGHPFCEVRLTFTDCESQLGDSFHEVEVSRRITREGASVYAINGRACRLKDVQRLFMDTGVGQVAYSFLVQGQVDQILSSNPLERRTIFEEAAGITKYKSQRKETLNKLSLVDANLARVTDVIEEVGRQIGTLKRQASKALRYKRIRHRQTNLALALASHRSRELQEAIGGAEAELADLRAKAAASEREIRAQEAAMEGDRAKRNEKSALLEKKREALFDLRSERDNLTGQAEMLRARIADYRNRIGAIDRELESGRQTLDELDRREEDEAGARESSRGRMDDYEAANQAAEQAFHQEEERVRATDKRFREAREALAGDESRIARLRATTTSLEVDLKSYQIRHAGLADTLHGLGEEAGVLGKKRAATRTALEKRNRELAEVEQRVTGHAARLEELRGRFRQQQTTIQESDRELARLKARHQVLTDLQERLEGFGEGVKALLQGKLGPEVDVSGFRVLGRLLDVEEGFTGPVELLLGPAIDAVHPGSARPLPDLLARMREKRIGRTALLHAAGDGPADPAPPPSGLRPARELVRARDPGLEPFVERFFAGCFVAGSDADAFGILAENPGLDFRWIVTPEGTLFSPAGVAYGGRAISDDQSLLGREKEIAGVSKKILALESRLEDEREEAGKIQLEVEGIEAELETDRNAANEARRDISTLESEERALAGQAAENARKAAQAEDERRKQEEAHREAERALEASRRELGDLETAQARGREGLEALETGLEAARNDREKAREAWTETRLRLAESRQQLELLEKGIDEIERRRGELRERADQLRGDRTSLEERIAEAEAAIAEQGARSEDLDTEIRDAQEALEGERTGLRAFEESLADRERDIAAEREKLATVSRRISAIEVDLARQRSRLEFILEKTREEHGLDARHADWRRALWEADREFAKRVNLDEMEDGDPLDTSSDDNLPEPAEGEVEAVAVPDWDEIDTEVTKLRERLQGMGPVNLVAIEEYRELKERHEFLKAQSDDLWNSKEELIRAIDEINETSQALFQSTFEKIRENFKYTYDHLTGGGFGDLALIDAEDVLDSGIEIKARPPGVKQTSLSLLSGGQRTMAAVALLFAIYMVKPSPFCVLDELDAPLDDSNIGRFTEMLRSFTEFSQFLIITHSKRTISSADSVFGVTMQEKGVSRLLSMKFNHHTQKAEFVEPTPAG